MYNLTLQKSGGVNGAVYGNFSAPKAQEIAVIRNKIVELLRPDETGRVQTVTTVEAFGIVRSIASFRLAGANRDYLVVGSDSGRVVFLQFNKEKNAFVKGKPGDVREDGMSTRRAGTVFVRRPKGKGNLSGGDGKE